jgi:hypothetical protein
MNIPGISSSEKVDRVDRGTGQIHERTIELADVVLAISNIGSMSLIDQKREHGLTVVGGLVAFMGLLALTASTALAGFLIVVGILIIFWSLNRALDSFLSIGTCDGRQLHLVSKDRKFLLELRTFVRTKIDGNSEKTATFNISNSSISGGIAVGSNPNAGGGGSITR